MKLKSMKNNVKNHAEKIYKKHKLILVDDLSSGSKNALPKELRKKLIKKKIQSLCLYTILPFVRS